MFCDICRSFYLALWRHAMSVGRKGCYRTALEYFKLILRWVLVFSQYPIIILHWHCQNLFELFVAHCMNSQWRKSVWNKCIYTLPPAMNAWEVTSRSWFWPHNWWPCWRCCERNSNLSIVLLRATHYHTAIDLQNFLALLVCCNLYSVSVSADCCAYL